VRRAIAGIGRTLVTLGLLILLFVVYQLWGTGIFTARAQENLKNKFQEEMKQYAAENDTVGPVPTTVKKPASKPTPTTTTVPYSNARPPIPTPAEGDVEGWITIPRIGLHMLFVEGTSRDDLKKGPGHYPGTPLPGTIGNAAIAGHRTTYLHPFWGLDDLQPGDDIIIETFAGSFDYRVSTPWFTVKPTDVWVVGNTPDPELTLTACHPKGSAALRIVIKAKLVPAKSTKPTKPKPRAVTVGTGKGLVTQEAGLAEGLSGQTRSLVPSVVWGIIAALVGLGWWWTFRRWRHPLIWLTGVLPFLVALFPFYVYLERALPAGY
jgi:sortase A